MSFRESEQDHGYGRDDAPVERPYVVHLDFTPAEAEPKRACGATSGSVASFAYDDEIMCDDCLGILRRLRTGA